MIRISEGEDVHTADVRTDATGTTVTVGDATFRLDVSEVAPGTFVLQDGPRSETFHCVRDGALVHLAWRGRVYRLREEAEAARGGQREKSGGLESPMPGKVIAVRVTVGQDVKKGDEILVVEAMKMENAIRAPRDGRVVSLFARVGDMVAPGTMLAEIA